MSMSKQDFVALAHVFKQLDVFNAPSKETIISYVADFCESQNPRFNRQRWLDYIAGKCGPNGGKVKV